MGQLNIARNCFLEKEELTRQFERFSRDEGYFRNLSSMTKSWGILPVDNNDIGNNFKVVMDESVPYRFVLDTSIDDHTAITEEGYVVTNKDDWYYDCPTDDTWRYVYVKYDTTGLESGTVDLSLDGSLSGSDTEFSTVLRGITTKVPSVIRLFESDGITELGDYQLVSVTSDTQALISGSSITGTGLKYQVLGSFSPSETDIVDTDKQIYSYDSFSFSVLETDTTPDGYIKLAKIIASTGTLIETTTVDLRADVWKLKNGANWGYVNLDDYDDYGYNEDNATLIIPRWGDSFYCTIDGDIQIDTIRYIRDSEDFTFENVEISREFSIEFNITSGDPFLNVGDGSIYYPLAQESGSYIVNLHGGSLYLEEENYYHFKKFKSGIPINLVGVYNNFISLNNLKEFDIDAQRTSYPSFDSIARDGSGKFKFRQVNAIKELTENFTLLDLDSGSFYGDWDYIDSGVEDEGLYDLYQKYSYDFENLSALGTLKFYLTVSSIDSDTLAGRYPRAYFLSLLDSTNKLIFSYEGFVALSGATPWWKKTLDGVTYQPTEFSDSNLGSDYAKYTGTNGKALSYSIKGDMVTIEGWVSKTTTTADTTLLSSLSSNYNNILPAGFVYGTGYANYAPANNFTFEIDNSSGGTIKFYDVGIIVDLYINITYRRTIFY